MAFMDDDYDDAISDSDPPVVTTLGRTFVWDDWDTWDWELLTRPEDDCSLGLEGDFSVSEDDVHNHPISGHRLRRIYDEYEPTRTEKCSWKSHARKPAQYMRHKRHMDHNGRRRINDQLEFDSAA